MMGRPKKTATPRVKKLPGRTGGVPLFPKLTLETVKSLRVYEVGHDASGEYIEDFEDLAEPSTTEEQLCDDYGELWFHIEALDKEGKCLENTRRDFRPGKTKLRSPAPKAVEVKEDSVIVPEGLTPREQTRFLEGSTARREARREAGMILTAVRDEHNAAMQGLVAVVQNLTRDPAAIDKRVQALEGDLLAARAELRQERAERRAERAELRAEIAELEGELAEAKGARGGEKGGPAKELFETMARELVPGLVNEIKGSGSKELAKPNGNA